MSDWTQITHDKETWPPDGERVQVMHVREVFPSNGRVTGQWNDGKFECSEVFILGEHAMAFAPTHWRRPPTVTVENAA